MRLPKFPFEIGPGAVIALAAALIIFGYTLYAATPYLLGPSLSVSEITENGITTITGHTARVSFLSIDGAPVPLEEDGNFTALRAYPAGYTAIQVSVKDRFGRTLWKTLSFLNK